MNVKCSYEPLEYVQLFKKSNYDLYCMMNNISHDFDIKYLQSDHHAEGNIWTHTMCVLTDLISRDRPFNSLLPKV